MNVTTQEERNIAVRKRISDLREIHMGKVPQDSPWLKTARMHYLQDGRRKQWDIIRVHDSVSIIVFNTSRRKLVFVRQFRPAVYYWSLPKKEDKVDIERYPIDLGMSLELCAGVVDKDKPLVEIAREELEEECGYEAPTSAFTEIITYR